VFTFEWRIRVYYEDTDSSGVVYYANYLRFMERARTEWLRSLGFEQDRLVRDEGMVFVVRSATIEFLRPARFNDLLTVISGLQHRGRASLTFTQSILRQHDASRPCCAGEVKIACVNAVSFRPQPLPDTLLKELEDVD